MPEYRTPLPGLFAALLEGAVNRVLDLDEDTPSRMQRLAGRTLQLDVEGLGISLFFSFDEHRVRVSTRSQAQPDTVVSGTPAALFQMAAPEGMQGWDDDGARVNVSGDAQLGRDLERLFSRLDPDWEGSFSRLFGDVLGFQLASGLREGASYARDAARETREMVGEFMQSPRGPVVPEREVTVFTRDVDDVSARTDALERRLDRLTRGPGDET
ncbi:MAG: hypothetical protein HKP19_08155 [Xanthomonadales bacterium]|nr:hypothetical protein [Xanthomonadales bacterium]